MGIPQGDRSRRRDRCKVVGAAAAGLTLFLGMAAAASAQAQETAQPPPQRVGRVGALFARGDAFLQKKMAAATGQPTPHQRGWAQVIVKIDGDLTPDRLGAVHGLGGYVYRRLPLISSAAIRVPLRSVHRLAARDWVLRLSTDAAVEKTDEFTVGHTGADLAYRQYGLTGGGVGVAVLDSGVNTSATDLYGDPKPLLNLLGIPIGTVNTTRVIANVNFVPGTSSAADACGHGTHVAGIIAGNGNASSDSSSFRTFYGVARKANIVNVRVLNQYGQGSVSSVIKGISWCIANKTKYKIRVLNLSLGHAVGESYRTDPLCQAVEAAWKSGIVVVTAAGNDGRRYAQPEAGRDNEGFGSAYGSIQSPANSPYAITVGAMKDGGSRALDRIATYSGRGPSRLDFVLKPDLVAPGNQIIAIKSDGSYLDGQHSDTNEVQWNDYRHTLLGLGGEGESTKYFRLSGTSMAAPVVAGAAALMLQRYPHLSPDTVKARLMLSADKWAHPDGTPDLCAFGAGYLDIPAALANTYVARTYALSPTMTREADGNVYVVNTADGSRLFWGEESVEMQRLFWGESVSEENMVDGSRLFWGEQVWDDNAVWGVYTDQVDLTSIAIHGEK